MANYDWGMKPIDDATQPPHPRPVRVETFRKAQQFEDRLNEIALDPLNRFELHSFSDGPSVYTAIFIYVPETKE
jgi:hypothetical protein